MVNVPPTMGERIVQLARVAVAMHMDESRRATRTKRQWPVAGGAGSSFTEERLPLLSPPRLARLGLDAAGGAE